MTKKIVTKSEYFSITYEGVDSAISILEFLKEKYGDFTILYDEGDLYAEYKIEETDIEYSERLVREKDLDHAESIQRRQQYEQLKKEFE